MCNRFSSIFLFPRLPFDWKTPFGYVLAWFAQAAAANSCLVHVNLVMCFLIGSCCLIIGILKDIENDFAHLNGNKTSKRRRGEMNEQFCFIVRFHTDVRQLSSDNEKKNSNILENFNFFLVFSLCRLIDELNKIYKFIITGVLCWALISLCVSILVFVAQLVEYTQIHRHQCRLLLSKLINFLKFFFVALKSLKSEETTNPITLIFPLLVIGASFFLILFLTECGEWVIFFCKFEFYETWNVYLI